MAELLRLVRRRGPVPDLPPAGDRPRLVRWRPWLPPFAGVVGRLAVEDAAVARLDVVVECPEARDILVGKCLYDALARVVGRAPQLHDEVPEQDRHADRELHARAHVGLAVAD